MTLGSFLYSFRRGHKRRQDRANRKFLIQAWVAGKEPYNGPLSIYADSTICKLADRPKQAHAATTTPASGAIVHCWPLPPELARC